MKKIVLFLLLLTSLYSDAKIYTGASYGYFDESFDGELDAENSNNSATFKIGYGDREAYAIEFSIDWVDNKSKIFSDNDKAKYALNIEFVKALDLDIYINPFFKAGFGAGNLKIDRELQEKLNFGSFNLGAGIFIPVNDNFDLELGYKYRYLTYERLDTIAENISYSSNVNTAYAGINVRF